MSDIIVSEIILTVFTMTFLIVVIIYQKIQTKKINKRIEDIKFDNQNYEIILNNMLNVNKKQMD